MFFSSWLPNLPLVCINLRSRPKKRKIIKQHINNKYGRFKFHIANKHKNPKRGCLESHLAVIKEAIERGVKAICILEDDAKFIGPSKTMTPPPDNWDMLYLGGTVKDVYEPIQGKQWVKMRCWTTHAYILNLQNKKLVDKILEMEKYDKEVDRYYLDKIHPFFNCYMANPMICIQRPGYSDIEGCEVSYEFMQDTLQTFRKPEHDEVDGAYILKLPDIPEKELPSVTIITPTYNRRKIFALAIRNFQTQDYPADKLEWVILDDSDNPDLGIDDLLPTHNKRIRHIKIKATEDHNPAATEDRMTVAQKRNMGAEQASHDIIVHMDDDDYYPPSSVISRVKLLLKYRETGINCVGCSSIGVYDLINEASSISSDGTLALSEASMAYTKRFWEETQFNPFDQKGEYFNFIKDRFDQVIDMPYSFVIYALTHTTNLTDKVRRIKENKMRNRNNNEKINFIDTFWDEDTQFFIRNLAAYLKRSKK